VEESNSVERDGIQDFSAGDLIDLSRIDANTLLDGDQAFEFIGNAAFSKTAGELRFENISIGGPVWLVQGDSTATACPTSRSCWSSPTKTRSRRATSSCRV
jgi:hypothetical protein